MAIDIPKDIRSYKRAVKAAGINFVPLSRLETPSCGSKWNFADILTFRVILQKQNDEFPSFFYHLRSETGEKLKSKAFRNVAALVAESAWEGSPRDKLRRIGQEFGSFLSYLAEVLEEPWSSQRVPVPDRPKRDKPLQQYYMPSDEEEDSAHSVTSTEEQEREMAESSDDSDRSHEDQDTLNRQNKSETVTNCLIVEYLQTLASCTSGSDDRKFHLEWTTDQDAFQFQVPTESGLNTRNDGGLVHRRLDAKGKWARVEPLSCYCSIEAKAAHIAEGKKIEVYAQEVSQIVGMIHQREKIASDAGVPNSHRLIPLISISQHFVYVTITQYDPEYYNFLRTGEGEPFLRLMEYGPFKLTDHKRFVHLSQLIVALMLFLEKAGPHST